MGQRVQRIEEDERGNRQIRLANAASAMLEAYNRSSIDLSVNIENETLKGKRANNSSEISKYQERRPSRVAALALIVGTVALAAAGLSNYVSPAAQAISLGSDAAKKPFEAKGIASSGLEQYTRIALEKLREMVSMISKTISEITNEVTNINRQTGGM